MPCFSHHINRVWYNKEEATANNVCSCTAKHYRHMLVCQQSKLKRNLDDMFGLAIDKLNL